MDSPKRASTGAGKSRPTLLPSPLSDEGSMSGRAGGYEKDKLRDMFLSGQTPTLMTTTSNRTNPISNSVAVESDDEDNEHSKGSLREKSHYFKPFFTIIEDSRTGDYFHPHVHYIFSDDDPTVLTDTLLSKLQSMTGSEDDTSKRQVNDSSYIDERVVILDLAESGDSVSLASSLCSTWQIINHTIIPAPTFDQASGSDEKGMMLKISGREAPEILHKRGSEPSAATKDDEVIKSVIERFQDLANEYEEGIDSLRRAAGLVTVQQELPT